MAIYMRPLSEIKPDYNFLMGYQTGVPKEWYCGIEGITHIFMGAWNDPMIGYKGYAFNEPWYTDGLYDVFCEETGEEDLDKFAVWLKENADMLKADLDEAIWAYENEEKEIRNDSK